MLYDLRKIIGSAAVVTLVIFGYSSAHAAPLLSPQIDFRDQMFSGANFQHSFSAVVDGIAFTITAEIEGAPSGGTATLWWDSKDGLGVRHNYESDEIEGTDRLRLAFEETIGLSEIYVADLFVERGYSEIGYFQIDGEAVFGFDAQSLMGTDGDKANGEHLITVDPIIPVNDIVFFSPGRIGRQKHEFALLGFTDPPLSMTEPAALALFGLGLVGLAFTRRKRAT